MIKKTITCLFLFFSVVLYFGSGTGAYILSGPHILHLMLENIGKSKGLLIEQQLKILNEIQQDDSLSDSQSDSIELSETLSFSFPLKFRSDIIANNIQRSIIVSQKGAWSLTDGIVSEYFETRFDLYKDIFLYNSRELLEKRLSLLGVNINISSFGRFQGRTAYVIGAKYPDESAPQIWFDKETFMPFRWIITGKTPENPEDFFEIRYRNWQKTNNIWYPMLIEFFHNNNKLREIKAVTVITDPFFEKNIFNIESIKSVSASVMNSPEDLSGEMMGIKKTIEQFKKIYE
jgi:hypothetical protein